MTSLLNISLSLFAKGGGRAGYLTTIVRLVGLSTPEAVDSSSSFVSQGYFSLTLHTSVPRRSAWRIGITLAYFAALYNIKIMSNGST
jgi:hypothetical protein